MTDSDCDDQLPPGVEKDSGALARVRSLARRGRHRLIRAARRRLEDVGDRLRDQFHEFLSDPEQVQRLQKILARTASWSLQRGFETDPNAGLLFEFVDWLEERHDRRTIATILLRSSVLADPEFLEAFAHLSRAYSPVPASGKSDWDTGDIDRFKKRAGNRLLDLLVELAALETDDPPPQGPPSRQVEFFENAPLPPRFKRLAAMTRGRRLLDRSPPSGGLKWAKRLADRLPGNRTGSDQLRRFVPGTDDETLHFLVFSTSFFFQSYLLRNLIESLPGVAGELEELLRDEETIDID